jgi:hypothetical protein
MIRRVPLRRCEKESVRVRRGFDNCLSTNVRANKGEFAGDLSTCPRFPQTVIFSAELWKFSLALTN